MVLFNAEDMLKYSLLIENRKIASLTLVFLYGETKGKRADCVVALGMG